MQLTPATIDQENRLRGTSIHDAELQRLELVPSDRLALSFRSSDGTLGGLVLTGLAEIGLEHLTNGMIIFDIHAWRLDAPTATSQIWREAWRALLGDRCHLHDVEPTIARLIQRHAGLTLVYISSSFGGEVAAICQDVAWEDG